ncbi:class I SAM-dependent methyltransferase [Candidatus Parcubacteria bacterium]|nr:class I SAM-dependent methyltransferase [Candidatus Parcubacteria bacterium]
MNKKRYNPKDFWERRLEKNFNLKGVGYAKLGEQYNKWLYKARIRTLDQTIEKHNISCENKKILELGVGSGFYVNYWKKKKISEFIGIDITEKSVKELSSAYPEYKFIRADISSPDLPIKEKFDIITVFDVLFHVLDEDKFEQIIQNIKKISHEKSIILIMDSYLKHSYQESFHVKLRTLSRYIEVLKKNEMKIKVIKPIFYFMSKPLNSKFLHSPRLLLWYLIASIIVLFDNSGKYGKVLNNLIGKLLYSIDKIILKYNINGPSTKLMVISRNNYN